MPATTALQTARTKLAKLWAKRPHLDKKAFFKKHGKKAFWLWIAYQSIKGITTLSLIWVPLALHTCSK